MNNLQNNLNIDLSQAKTIQCSECNGEYFEEVVMLKKLSKFITGADKDSVIPIPVLRCVNCGNVNEEFKPKL